MCIDVEYKKKFFYLNSILNNYKNNNVKTIHNNSLKLRQIMTQNKKVTEKRALIV